MTATNHTHRAEPAEPSVGELVKEATTALSTVLHGEIELAKIELKSTVRNLGTGVIGFVLAAVLALFALTFLFIGLAELLAWAYFWRWAAYGIVFVFILAVAGLSAYLGYRKVRQVRAPERTIETTKSTVAALRHPRQQA